MENSGIPQDDLKWFGEGFDGFPKRLPDSTVEYIIFIIDNRLKNDSAVRIALNDVLKEANRLAKELLKEYIWQRDSFKLELERSEGRWILRGQTNYGDSVADEWLIVYLLRELSPKFSQSWIRVFDTDGEFLLIEAANTLPRWLNPEIAENRVWIHNGQLRIIPLAQKGDSAKKPLTISEALSFISSTPEQLIHSPLIEEEAYYRLRNYPSQITSSLHNALITIPRKLAYLLHRTPAYISPAVEAFYVRDPISLKPLQQNDSSALHFPARDLVTTSVRFTQVGYAQLKSQEFEPPPTWEDLITGSDAEKTRLEMGMKVTSAFEMLLHDPQTQKQRAVQEMHILIEDINSGDEPLPSDADIATWSKQDDDEGWLDIDMNDFDRELSGKGGGASGNTGQGFGDKSAEELLKKMVQRFDDFLKDDKAGAEGVDDMDDMDIDDDEEDSSDDEEDREVSFDEQQFEEMMREMMGIPLDVKLPQSMTQAARESRVEELDSETDEDDAEEIEELSKRMEAELRTAGALKLDPPQESSRPTIKGKEKAVPDGDEREDKDEDEDEEVDVDFNLVKNMLESLKSEQGMAGPAGNLLASMGIRMPRDDGDRAKK